MADLTVLGITLVFSVVFAVRELRFQLEEEQERVRARSERMN